MDTWNREELYREIWNEPMSKLSKKYGISGVMLGKVCRKLSIPVPGRGYWARKAFGHSVEVQPLPQMEHVPVVQRFKLLDQNPPEHKVPEPQPSDAEFHRILEVESRHVSVDPTAPLHRFVVATAKAFRSTHADYQGYRSTRGRDGVLDLNLTEKSLDRAILILNAEVLDAETSEDPKILRERANTLSQVSTALERLTTLPAVTHMAGRRSLHRNPLRLRVVPRNLNRKSRITIWNRIVRLRPMNFSM